MVNRSPGNPTDTPHRTGLADGTDLLEQGIEGGIIAIDEQQNIVAFTGEAESCTGLAAPEILGKPISALPGPLRELLQKTFATGQSHREAQMILRSDDGHTVTARVSTTALRGPNGQPCGALALLHDLGPIRNLEQRLRRLDRLASLGTLSASVAHEVKNALVAVKTFVDLLRQSHPNAPLAQVVNREILRIDSIVSQLLRFSGATRATFESLGLHEILERSLSLMQHQFEGNKIRIVRSLEASPDSLQGDAYQLEQAFMNLLLNSLEAMGSSGELNVATRIVSPEPAFGSDLPQLQVSFRDSGMGIPPENLERLFEPFFTTKAHGTGLGLPITRRIIQEHQGTIRVESLANAGTTFVMTFPSAAKQP